MRYLLFFIMLLGVNAVFSQDVPKWFSGKLKQLTFSFIDNNDKVQGRMVFTKDRADSSNGTSFSIFGKANSAPSGNSGYGSDQFTDIYEVKIDTNGFYLDYGLLRNFYGSSFRSTEVIIIKDKALLFYPKNPQIGQEIPTDLTVKTHFYMEQSGHGDPAQKKPFSFRPGDNSNLQTGRVKYTRINERKVIAKESKTIMGNRLETYVIQHSISTASKRDGKFSEGGYMKEWYNLNAGLVAYAIYNNKDKLIMSGVLTSVE